LVDREGKLLNENILRVCHEIIKNPPAHDLLDSLAVDRFDDPGDVLRLKVGWELLDGRELILKQLSQLLKSNCWLLPLVVSDSVDCKVDEPVPCSDIGE
jgi:hypothetical protein